MSPITTRAGYAATRESDGTLVVHRVPIFVECERGETSFDAEWIAAAIAKARQAEAEGYLPPLHIRHHEAETAANDSVRAAGFFRILESERITFKGELRLAILADLIVTDPAAQADILAKRLPYRSVEIFNVGNPAIDGLALLDHEAPFLELPMLMVGRINEHGPTGVADATLQCTAVGSVAASFKRGCRANILFREEDRPVTDATEAKPETETSEKGPEASTPSVAALIESIEDGSITVADMVAIIAAIEKQRSAAKPDAEGTDQNLDKPAPAAVPGGESMKRDPNMSDTITPAADAAPENLKKGEMGEAMAALQGELEGTKARLAAIEAEAKRKEAVAAALKRLEGRPLGADLEQRLFKAHAEHGAAAFSFFVESMEKAVGVLPTDTTPGLALKAGEKVSAVAMKYQSEGVDAIDRAAKFSREWGELHRAGLTRMSEDRYVAVNMAKLLAVK